MSICSVYFRIIQTITFYSINKKNMTFYQILLLFLHDTMQKPLGTKF